MVLDGRKMLYRTAQVHVSLFKSLNDLMLFINITFGLFIYNKNLYIHLLVIFNNKSKFVLYKKVNEKNMNSEIYC